MLYRVFIKLYRIVQITMMLYIGCCSPLGLIHGWCLCIPRRFGVGSLSFLRRIQNNAVVCWKARCGSAQPSRMVRFCLEKPVEAFLNIFHSFGINVNETT